VVFRRWNKRYRHSKQRQLILGIVQNAADHPTADRIFQIARKQMPTISLGTVYRNLQLLSETGLISSIRLDDKSIHYDRSCASHFHFVCRKCHHVEDIPPDSKTTQQLHALTDHQVDNVHLQLYGVCRRCQNKQE